MQQCSPRPQTMPHETNSGHASAYVGTLGTVKIIEQPDVVDCKSIALTVCGRAAQLTRPNIIERFLAMYTTQALRIFQNAPELQRGIEPQLCMLVLCRSIVSRNHSPFAPPSRHCTKADTSACSVVQATTLGWRVQNGLWYHTCGTASQLPALSHLSSPLSPASYTPHNCAHGH